MKDNLTDSLENISVEKTVKHDTIDINRDKKLKIFLESISKKEIDEDSEKKEAYSILKEIYYENKFRHRYSYITSIFPIILHILHGDSHDNKYSQLPEVLQCVSDRC